METKQTAGKGRDARPMRLVVTVTVFYLLLVALNAEALHLAVERMPYGAARSFWVRITGPVSHVCGRLYLTYPRAFLRRTLGARINAQG